MGSGIAGVLVCCLIVLCAVADAAVVETFEQDRVKSKNHADPFKYRDCDDIYNKGLYNDSDTLYDIYFNDSTKVQVKCRFEGGSQMTYIMEQKYAGANFVRPFIQYENGFGSSGEFWYGLKKMRSLILNGNRVLTIQLQDWNRNLVTLKYLHIDIADSSQGYRLYVSQYRGTLPEQLSYNNGMPFATYDRPDIHRCASDIGAGWWYNYCTYFLPTGHYYYGGPYTPSGGFCDGIFYFGWPTNNCDYSLLYVSMALSRS